MVMEVVAKAVKERIAVVIVRVARLAKDVEAIGRTILLMPIGRKSMRHWRIAIPVTGRSRWEPVRPVSFPRGVTACVQEIPSPLIRTAGS